VLSGSVVHVQPGARCDLLELLEGDVEAVRDGIGTGLDERLTSPQAAPLDARQRRCDPLACLGALERPIVDLHRPHARLAAAGLDGEDVALADRA
jgi:hypothetical protein